LRKINSYRTIRKDLLALIILSILIPFTLISFVFIYNVKNIIDKDVKDYQEAIVTQSSNNLINIFSNIKMIQRATIGKVISDYIIFDNSDNFNKNEISKLKDLIEYLYITDNASSNINGIYVIFDKQYVISSRLGIRDNLLLDRPWLKNSSDLAKNEYFTKVHSANYNVALERDDYDRVISYIQQFTLPEKNGDKVIIQIDIDMSAFQNFIDSSENAEQIPMYLLYRKNNEKLLQNEIYSKYISNRPKDIIVKKSIVDSQLELIGYIRQDQFFIRVNSAILVTIITIFLIAVVSLIIAILFSRAITSPLHELYISMKKVGQGNFSPSYPSTNYYELDYLIERFKKMVDEVDSLIDVVVKKEGEATEAKFQALQAKINPHFLYNTLDVIRSIALENDNEDISSMTLSLSRLFRYNVGNLKETNKLGVEIEYLKDYLKIQEYRFGDRITTSFNIGDGLKSIEIARFIIQPIIENAFKYGLELATHGGELKVSAKTEEEILVIEVYNNGPFIEPDKLLKLKKSFNEEPNISSVTSAHGLDNVNLRLKLLYGSPYGLDIDSNKDGTTVYIKIPYTGDLDG